MMQKELPYFNIISSSFLFQFLVLSSSSSATRHDMSTNPPTVFPTNPTTTPPETFPPAIITPTNPTTTSPVTIPSTSPITLPPVVTTNPTTTTVPEFAPPVVTNAPAIPGQSWCVARPGTSQISLQEALDFACGVGGADCSQIQQGGNCYIPNTIQNHASAAFNSYYQKNPSPQSCDFGGAAVVVNTNPSSGSCIYQLFSSASLSTPTPSTQTVTQPATPTAITPTGGGMIGYATPPPVFNPANPFPNTPTNPASGTTAAVYGFDGSPSTTSESTRLQIRFDHVLVTATSVLAGFLGLWK
ncbi:PREDICTED: PLASMODESMATA CALLOSE-BINDING PROTEIN 4-like [Tarenaya hassleriana]|uniref:PLASMODESMATA CALLOSE-BINDING PROTEIN 4-like n=1 Tax=Tarenaya hassleriana TaxID=28532 RepID=UPI00053C950E|nr:PREDICTED: PLASMODESMATA CALLOSE-BINDING PROTEIN 4-like [Tarenaya hassleriana]